MYITKLECLLIIHDKEKSIFIIINDSIVWIYTLKKDDSMKWVDNNEKESDKGKNK